MKGFNSVFFIICTIVLAAVAYESYIQAVAIDEGRIGDSVFRHAVANLFNIMRFPMHVMFKAWARIPLKFAIGLIINCLFYSFILERILYFITRPKPEEEETYDFPEE